MMETLEENQVGYPAPVFDCFFQGGHLDTSVLLFLLSSSPADSRGPASFKQDRHTDPNNSE